MHDLVIIGGGPAGYTAGIYAGRYLLDAVVIAEKKSGTLMDAPLVENFPGFPSMRGFELGKKIESHLSEYDVPIKREKAVSARKEGDAFIVKTDKGEHSAKALILATGWKRRKLPVEGVDKLEHKGVSYCATCDAPLFADKVVAVIGGGDAGVGAAIMISEYASKVYIVEVMDELAAEPIKQERIKNNEKIEVFTGTQVEKVIGDSWIERIVLSSGKELDVQGMFIEIGGFPRVQLARDLGVGLDERDNIVIDAASCTNVEGVFAAGDVTNVPFKQAVVASGQGASAAWSAYRFLKV